MGAGFMHSFSALIVSPLLEPGAGHAENINNAALPAAGLRCGQSSSVQLSIYWQSLGHAVCSSQVLVRAPCRNNNNNKAASPKVALCELLAVSCIVTRSTKSKKRIKKNLISSARPPERRHNSESSFNEKGGEVTSKLVSFGSCPPGGPCRQEEPNIRDP